MAFTVRLANYYIKLESDSSKLQEFFHDYIVLDKEADFSISWSENDFDIEEQGTGSNFSHDYLETLVVLRKISEIFPQKDCLLFHGASISYRGQAYLFAAPSGTGKSTHIRLWKKYLGSEVGIVNGDKPFISFKTTPPLVHGTPWAGKERWQKNCQVPLRAICFIKRGTINKIRKTSIIEALPLLMKQIYIPQDETSAAQTLALIDLLIKKVPLYLLECDMSEDAVRCSFEELTGLSYISNKNTN